MLPSGHAGRFSLSERMPVGLVGVITPWNFPLVLGMRVIAPALALGNAVLLKPSPETPVSGGLAIAELFEAAGAPGRASSRCCPATSRSASGWSRHPDVAMIHFTGSTAVGRQIAQTAGGLLKKVSLELGGNNALIVLDDADLDQATMIGAWSSFHYQGQTCITAGRHIVQRGDRRRLHRPALAARADAITVGNTVTEDVGLGPMINSVGSSSGPRRCWTRRSVDGGRDRWPAEQRAVRTSGRPSSATSARSSRLWTEEIFAPIAPILVVDDDDEAVAVANDTDYGLVELGAHRRPATAASGSPGGCGPGWCTSTTRRRRTRRWPRSAAIGQSGLGGRSGGDANIEEFTERRWLTSPRAQRSTRTDSNAASPASARRPT